MKFFTGCVVISLQNIYVYSVIIYNCTLFKHESAISINNYLNYSHCSCSLKDNKESEIFTVRWGC